jgi:hypothetical protein
MRQTVAAETTKSAPRRHSDLRQLRFAFSDVRRYRSSPVFTDRMTEPTSVTESVAELPKPSRSPARKPPQASRSARRRGPKTRQRSGSQKSSVSAGLAESGSTAAEDAAVSVAVSTTTPPLDRPATTESSGPIQAAGQPDADASTAPQKSEHQHRSSEPRPEQRQSPSWRPAPIRDAEDLARKAWQIYSAEIAEDGVTLFDDKDASALARRAFRLAQVFLDAQHQQTSRGPRRDHPSLPLQP